MPDIYDICDIDAIPENAARGFSIETSSGTLDLFIVRKNAGIHGYINRCPHTGVNLNWQPDQFLDLDGNLIQCSTHGAQFRISNGYCVYGPCAGRSLSAVNLLQENGRIKLLNGLPL